MGRPLKIQKLSPGSGDSTTNGVPVGIDKGFPNFNSLDDATIPTGMTGTEYLGVVGGGFPGGVATPTYPTVKIQTTLDATVGVEDAWIIRQKGQTKYLVAGTTVYSAGTAGEIVRGGSYVIEATGTTNWQIYGAGQNAAVGDTFTSLITSTGDGSTGSVARVGVGYLANTATPGAGQVSIETTVGANTFYASRLENKYVWDWSNPPVRYAADFFVNDVTTAKSGAEPETWTNTTGNLTLAQPEDWTA